MMSMRAIAPARAEITRHAPAAPVAARKVSAKLSTTSLARQVDCACGGICPRCTVAPSRSLLVQPRLRFGAPNDKCEQEADRVADRVMRMPEPTVQSVAGIDAAPANKEEREQEELLQARTTGGVPDVPASVQTQIDSMRGGGQPLPEASRQFFETHFGHDFSQVRIHTDSQATDSARTINAVAYTVGSDIAFAAGQYSPDTQQGKSLLAHELSHVVQQSTGSVSEVVQRKPDKGWVGVEVVETNGTPIKGAQVELFKPDTNTSHTARTDANGLASLQVEEGDYILSVHVPDSDCYSEYVDPFFIVRGNTTEGTTIRLRNRCIA